MGSTLGLTADNGDLRNLKMFSIIEYTDTPGFSVIRYGRDLHETCGLFGIEAPSQASAAHRSSAVATLARPFLTIFNDPDIPSDQFSSAGQPITERSSSSTHLRQSQHSEEAVFVPGHGDLA